MHYQKVEYTIAPDGSITEKVIDGRGEGCTAFTKGVEEKLGRIENQKLLPEFSSLENQDENQVGNQVQYTIFDIA